MSTPGVTITYLLQDSAGNPVAGKVTAVLGNFGSAVPSIAGTSVLAIQSYTSIANTTTGLGSLVIYGNYQIAPANTVYTITIYGTDGTVANISQTYLLSSGGTFDLSSMVPISSFPGSGVAIPVTSFNGRIGVVVATSGDYTVAQVTGAAPLASPVFTGTPSLPTGTTAITQTAGDNTTKLATTAFVIGATGSGIPITGTLTHAGMIPISQPGNTTAAWADPLVQGLFAPGANVLTANTGSTAINPVLIGAANPSNLLKNLNVDASGNLLVTGATTIGGTVAVTGTFFQATQPVSGTFFQTTQPVSGTVAVTGTFWQTTQPVSIASMPSTPVTGTFWQATQPVSLASTTVTGSVAVTGTFFQTTQPVSIASMPSTPVTGTFWQSTQPVSLTSTTVTGSVAVTGTFFQATQPISIAAALPAGTNLLGITSSPSETSTIYNGTTALTPLFANITASSSGATSVVAAVTSKRIRVLSFRVTASAAVNVKFQSHVVSPPSATDITGLAYYAANGGEVTGFSPVGWFQTNVGEELDINLSGAIAVGGSIVYVTV